jgi:hypothetical protein
MGELMVVKTASKFRLVKVSRNVLVGHLLGTSSKKICFLTIALDQLLAVDGEKKIYLFLRPGTVATSRHPSVLHHRTIVLRFDLVDGRNLLGDGVSMHLDETVKIVVLLQRCLNPGRVSLDRVVEGGGRMELEGRGNCTAMVQGM